MFSADFFQKIAMNILVMFALSGLILSANKSGVIDFLLRPMNNINNGKVVVLLWFVTSTVLSAFTLDTTLALILIPMALIYAEKRCLDKVELSLAVTWGNMVGSDWTYFGGGDVLISWTLLEKAFGRPLDILTWGSLLWPPTLLACLVTMLWLGLVVIKGKQIVTKPAVLQRPSLRMICVGVLLLGGIVAAFLPHRQLYTIGFSLVAVMLAKMTTGDMKKLPFKGVYIWFIAILFGTLLSNFIQTTCSFVIPDCTYTLFGIAIVLLVLGLMTNVMTNSAMAAIVLPIIIGSSFIDKMWLYVLATKAISMSYLTIFANAGLAVVASYDAIDQKILFKKGLPVVILQTLLYIIYFYAMRGMLVGRMNLLSI